MLFSDNIPTKVLDSEATRKFIDVLDALQQYKHSIIMESLRFHNPALCFNKKWLIKQLEDYGFKNIPEEMPLRVLQQMLLNAQVIFVYRGSRLGLELFCSSACLGEVSFSGELARDGQIIFLDSKTYGFVTKSTDKVFYLCDNNELNARTDFYISVDSIYFNEESAESNAIKTYLQTNVDLYLNFHSSCNIHWTFNGRESLFYHDKLNKHFIDNE